MTLKPENKIITVTINHVFVSFPTVQIYDIPYIHLYTSLYTLYRYIMNSQRDLLPDGLIAQLVEHCTGIAEVMGLHPVQA